VCSSDLGIFEFQFPEELFKMSDDVSPQGTPTSRGALYCEPSLHFATYKI
jgi:hypothetical protein